MRLLELQVKNQKAQRISEQGLKKGWINIAEVLYHKSLAYVPEIIITKLICKYHDNPLAEHFGIQKT